MNKLKVAKIHKSFDISIAEYRDGTISAQTFCHNLLLIALEYWQEKAYLDAVFALKTIGSTIIEESIDAIIDRDPALLDDLNDMVGDVESRTSSEPETTYTVNGPRGEA